MPDVIATDDTAVSEVVMSSGVEISVSAIRLSLSRTS